MTGFAKLIWLVPDPDNVFFVAYARQFTTTGCEVTLYPYRQRLLERGLPTMQAELLGLVGDYDVVFISLFAGTFELSPAFCATLHVQVPIVLWAADDELYSTRQTAFYAGVIDAVVSADYWGRGLLDQLGVPTFYLPLHNPDIVAEGDAPEKTIDVSFVGNCMVADRRDAIAYLTANGIRVETYGFGSANGYVSQDQYIEIVRRSRINLNFTRANFSSEDLDREPWRQMIRQLKGRPFEVAALGSFCLSEYAPHLEEIFSPGEEIGVFHDKPTLLAQVCHYLADAEKREAMASAARGRVGRVYGMPECLNRLMADIAPAIASRRQRLDHSALVQPVNNTFVTDLCVGALTVVASMARQGHFALALATLFRLPGRDRPFAVVIPALWCLLRQFVGARA